MKTDTVDKIMLIIMFLCIVFGANHILNTLSESYSQKERMEKNTTREWCLEKTIQSGESFGDGKPGTYEYHLVNTMKGVEVYKRCAE